METNFGAQRNPAGLPTCSVSPWHSQGSVLSWMPSSPLEPSGAPLPSWACARPLRGQVSLGDACTSAHLCKCYALPTTSGGPPDAHPLNIWLSLQKQTFVYEPRMLCSAGKAQRVHTEPPPGLRTLVGRGTLPHLPPVRFISSCHPVWHQPLGSLHRRPQSWARPT